MTTTQARSQTGSRIPVTLNCSGGISLGAYMAGVFYELTKEALKEDGTIAIDIVTGASAGAITATLATYYLLGAEPLPDNAKESLFYQAWVEKVDINSINAVGKGPEEDKETQKLNWSLLSGKAIEQISQDLVGKCKFIEKIEQVKQPVALLVTLTNLQGLLKKTGFPLKAIDSPPCSEADKDNAEKIKTISSAEIRQFLFHSGLLQSKEKLGNMWQKAELSGRASGAFPVAFPPIGDRSEIQSPNLADLSDDYFINPEDPVEKRIFDQEKLKGIYADPTHLQFQYTDGGVLDGLPIVRGILFEKLLLEEGDDPSKYFGATDSNLREFREEWQQLNLNPDERLYVYIQPTPSEDIGELSRLTMDAFSMLDVGLSGLTLPKAEHDAVRLENVRQRNQDACRKQKLLYKLDELFQKLNDEQRSNFAEIKNRLECEIDKAIPYRYIKLCRIDPSLLADAYADKKLMYPKIAAALKDNLTGYMKEAITYRQIKRLLASDFLGAFGGFFDRQYREHDFLLGRICGQIWLLENCWRAVDENDPRIQALVTSIGTGKGTFLDKDPKPSALNSEQISIIERLIWRSLWILFMESRARSEDEKDEEKSLVSKLLGRVVIKAIALALLIVGITAIAVGVLIFKVLS